MAKIRVKYGGCGIKYKDGNGVERHALKTPENGAFECDDVQAERLVNMGVAEYVGLQWKQISDPGQENEEEADPDGQQEESGESSQENEEEADPEKTTGHLDAEQLQEMTIKQLKALAAEMGVDVSGCDRKSEYIAAIVAVEVELGPEVDPDDVDDPDNDLPDLSAADPE